MRLIKALTLLLLLLLVGACGRQPGSTQVEQGPDIPKSTGLEPQNLPGQAPALPAPAELAALPELSGGPRRTSYVENDLSHAGMDFSGSFPSHKVSPGTGGLDFEPAFGAAGDSFGNAAYAAYLFNIPGYDRDGLIRSVWSAPPSDSKSVWLGLANWSKNRWDWFPSSATYKALVADISPYINVTGGLVLVVLRTGSDASTLESVRIGAPLPLAKFTTSPSQGTPPFDSTVDASQSAAVEGSLTKYEFDLGNGSFIDNGTNPVIVAHYETVGTFNLRVRVTDSHLGQSIASHPLSVTGDWTHTWTRGKGDQIDGMVLDGSGNIYCCGTSVAPTLRSEAAVWKFDAAGNLLWVRGVAGNASTQFYSCSLGFDGNLVLGGTRSPGDGTTHGMLQKWTPDGDLIWASDFTQNDYSPTIARVLCNGNEIYIVGSLFTGDSQLDNDALFMHVSPDGELVWTRRWRADGDMQDDFLEAGALRSSIVIGQTGIVAAGGTGLFDTETPTWVPKPLILEVSEDGELIRSWQLDMGFTTGWYTALALSGSQVFNQRIIAAGRTGAAELLVDAKLSKEINGACTYTIPLGKLVDTKDLCFNGKLTGLVSAGSYGDSNDTAGLFTAMDPVSKAVSLQKIWPSGAGGTVFSSVRSASDSSLVLAGQTFTNSAGFDIPPGSAQDFPTSYLDVSGTLSSTFLAYDMILAENEVLEGTLDNTTLRGALVMHVVLP